MRLPRLKKSQITVTAALLLMVGTAHAAPKRNPPPVVVTIEGGGSVLISGAAGEREAKLGGPIQYGETIKTGADNAITIQYPDGSLLAVNKGTQIEIQERVRGAQYNKLVSGQVRGLIEKPKVVKEGESKKPHFLIRTKSAVLGVRGTDFIMDFEPVAARAKVYTLEGLVDVGKDEASMSAGQVAQVAQGQFVESSGSAITQPAQFDAKSYLQQYKAENLTRLPKFDLPVATGAGVPGAPTPGIPIPSGAGGKPDGEKKPEGKQPEASGANPATTGQTTPPEEEKKAKFFSFQVGGLFTHEYQKTLNALALSWNPTVPLFSTLYIRGHLGGAYSRIDQTSEEVWIAEYQGLAGLTLFDRIFGEAAFGEQVWHHYDEHLRSFVVGLNAGIVMSPKGILDRLYVGVTHVRNASTDQVRAGVGFKF